MPCARSIDVTVSDSGAKMPKGEKNDMSTAQIQENRGSGNTYSISIKHVPDLYVVDFDKYKDEYVNNIDPVILGDNPLYAYLMETKCSHTTTTSLHVSF